MEVLQATYRTQVFGKHTHEEFAIGVVDHGTHVSEWGGATHRAGPGAIIVNNPGDVHTGRAGDRNGWSYCMLYPPVALLENIASQSADSAGIIPRFNRPVLDDPGSARLLRQLTWALLAGTEPLDTHSRFLTLFESLLVRHTAAPSVAVRIRSSPPAIRLVREYLDAHLAASVTLKQLADLVSLHPLYLIRAFKQEVGLPPHAYLVHRRVQYAKQRLADGDPVAQVAAAAGFADQSHFSRQFKRVVGVPPGQFARAVFRTKPSVTTVEGKDCSRRQDCGKLR